MLSPLKVILTIILLVIAACARHQIIPNSPVNIPKPLRPPLPTKVMETPIPLPKESLPPSKPQIKFKTTPSQPVRQEVVMPNLDDVEPNFTSTAPISINIEGLPLPAFINEVFGNLLGLSFEIDVKIQKKRELITLRVSEPQTSLQLYRLALQVLNNYQVAVEQQGDILRFIQKTASTTSLDNVSLLVDGLTLPEVPDSHRPMIHFYTLKVVRNVQVLSWLREIFKNFKLTLQEDPYRNAIILIGTPQLVRQALEVITVMDQPMMRNYYSLQIEPAFLAADVLANKLVDILNAQGYGASTSYSSGSITIFPIKETNSIIVLAADNKLIAYVQQWAKQLDHLPPQSQAPAESKPTLFYYPVKNIAAELIAEVVNKLTLQNNPTPPAASESQQQSTNPAQIPKSNFQLVIDPHRNALLMNGTPEQWALLLPILQDMDQPPKQVLIEVTIAEITLTDKDEHGIEWVIKKAGLGGLDGQLGTIGAIGVGGSGLTYTLSNAGQARAILNAFATSSRATILSTPRLMVRSGSQASIDIGTEIPTLTSQSTTDQVQEGGNSAILQQIQYRRTGVLLSIKPVVYAGRRIDLDVDQQVSEARENTTSNINSPAIFNRTIKTKLTLTDGNSILLGGLISNNRTDGWSGVPLLSEIPILGQLFRVNRSGMDRTELVILIVPYIIDGDEEAVAITEAIKRQLKLLPNNATPLPPTP